MNFSFQRKLSAAADRTFTFMAERWIFSFTLSAFVLFVHLGDPPLISPDEGRNAEVAREMSQSHAWLVPTYDGLTYLDKPALYFKSVALSFTLFGESEGAARLSSALSALVLLVVVFLFCRRVYDERTGALAMLIVATTPLYMAFSRIVIFDMPLAFFVCSAIFACYIAEEHEGKRRTYWYLIGALAAGIATLLKGPVGFIVPILVVTLFHWMEGRPEAMKRFFALPNWAVFLAVILPWFVGLSLFHPDFPYYGIVKESLSRFATTEFRHTAPFYFYALIIASCFFAWSLLLPESIMAAWRSRERLTRADRLLVVWTVIVVVFFSISQSKLPGYILTAMIALGILTARVFAAALENRSGRAARIVLRGTGMLFLVTATATLFLVAVVLKPGALERALRFPHEIFQQFVPTFAPVAFSVGGVALLAAAAHLARDTRLAFAAFLSLPLLVVIANLDLLSVVF